MTVQATPNSLERELEYRKKLTHIMLKGAFVKQPA